MKSEYLQIGEIVRPQGVRGEVKLRADSKDEHRYAQLEQVYLLQKGAYVPCRVIKGRASGGFAYLQLENVNDRDGAEALRGTEVYVDRAHAAKLAEGQNYIADLIGMRVVTDAGEEIGTLREVIQTNPHCDVYAFDTARGDLMIPALKSVVLSADVEKNLMVLSAEKLPEVAVWEDEPAERDE